MKRISGLPNVYQVYRREALRAKAFRRFSFCCFGGWSTRCLPRQFFEGETRGFLPLFCILSTFRSMQGALCWHCRAKCCFLGKMSAMSCQKSTLARLNLKGGIPMRNLKRALSLGLTAAMACSQPGSHRGHDFRPDGDGLQRRELRGRDF